MWPDAFSEWNPLRTQKPCLLQLCPLDSFLSMNLFPLSNLFRLSGDLTFLNYTQSSCVTALISVCLPSVLLFWMQTCVTVYPLCVTSLLQQIQSSGNQVKVKFISGTFVPLRFTVHHMLIIWILNKDQKHQIKLCSGFWLTFSMDCFIHLLENLILYLASLENVAAGHSSRLLDNMEGESWTLNAKLKKEAVFVF